MSHNNKQKRMISSSSSSSNNTDNISNSNKYRMCSRGSSKFLNEGGGFS